MAFTGNIADWSLADILQVVASERKSGLLNLAHPDGSTIEFEFREGQIVRATDRPESGQHGGFTAFLTETGHITPDQIRAVARLREETKDDELEALERAGILDTPAHEGAFGAYCQELVYRALTWREGDYRFTARARSGSPAARKHVLSIDALLMEGMRRIDEAPRIQEIVLPETVFERAADPRSVAGLGRRENALIALVDGAKDARTLGHLAHLTEYEAGELLYNLHEAGLIRARRSADPLVLDLVEDAPSATSELARLVRLVLILGVMGGSLFLSWQRRTAIAGSPQVSSTIQPRMAEAEAFARELFRAYAGREPAGRIELERAELVVPLPPLDGSPAATEPAIDPAPPSD